MTAEQFVELIQAVGVVGLLALVIWTGKKRWWVWGWVYAAMVGDRDFWRDLALDLMGMTRESVEATAEAVRLAERRRRVLKEDVDGL